MDEPIDISQHWVVSGGAVNGTVVLDPEDVKDIDGQCFVRLAKQLRSTCRMLGFKTDGRPLSKTSIIEKLIELRDVEFRKHCKGYCENSLDDDDKQMSTRKLQPRHDIPPYVTLRAPEYTGIDSVSITMRLAKTPSLWVHLKPEVIAYLAAVARHEHDGGGVKRKHPSSYISPDARDNVQSDVKGVHYHYTGQRAGSYRAVYTVQNSESKTSKTVKKTKYFSSSSHCGTTTTTELREQAEHHMRMSATVETRQVTMVD